MSASTNLSEAPGLGRPLLFSGAPRRRLESELLIPSRIRGYSQFLGNVGVFVLLLVLARLTDWIPGLAALYVAIGFALHRLFFPLHDCIHYSLFPTKTENRLTGIVLAAFLGTSFDAIRDQHMDHHRNFATADDPGAPDYLLRFRSRKEFLVFLLAPLAGSILFTKLGDYLKRPGRTSEETRAGFWNGLFRYGLIVIAQAGVCAVLSRGFDVSQLWRYPVFNVLPGVTIFLFLTRSRMFLEHGSLDYSVCDYTQEKRPTARTIYATWVERILFCGSNFNFHHEHHLYPAVPGWKLPDLHRDLLKSGLDSEDIRQTYLQSLREIWRNLPAPRGAGAIKSSAVKGEDSADRSREN